MTTTQTETRTCRECREHPATVSVRAQHLDPDPDPDPDPDEDGRPIGWSRSDWYDLCDDCLETWRTDELVAVCEVTPS